MVQLSFEIPEISLYSLGRSRVERIAVLPYCYVVKLNNESHIMMAKEINVELYMSSSLSSVHDLNWSRNYSLSGDIKKSQCFSLEDVHDLNRKIEEQHADQTMNMDVMSDYIQNQLSRYTTIEKIGEGTFGHVHVAYDNVTKQNVAVKVLKEEDEDEWGSAIKYGMVEVEMLSKLKGFSGLSKKLCVEMLDWYTIDDVFQIVFPLYGENLLSFRERNKNHTHFLIEDVRSIAFQLCHAVRFLHRHGMIHTDVKLCNIVFLDSDYYEYEVTYDNFLDLDGKPMSQKILRVRKPLIKLIDFGSAVWSPSKDAQYSHNINTRVYRAPEVILRLNWDKSSDIWSIACTIFELLYGQSLFDTDDDLEHLGLIEKSIGNFPKSMINKSKLKDFFDAEGKIIVSDNNAAEIIDDQESLENYVLRVGGPEYSELNDLLQKMFHLDPSKRISLCRAVYHHFFTSKSCWPADE